ncbi:MAG: hypothetical protein ACI362_09125 [Coriobacteriales bacterium]
MKTDERLARVTRLVNAGVAALLVVAFLGHALFVSAAGVDAASRAPYPLLYCLLALVAVHIALSVATTVLMWNDTVRPPSEKKKRHQVLKWVTGTVVLAVLCVHVVHPAAAPVVTWTASAVLLAAFVWHGWTGMKSLARDLRVPGKAKVPLRIALVALALIAFFVMIAARL